MATAGDIFLAVLALFFPPLAVWVKRGICSCDSLLNILLCVLGVIPGLIHAWYIIAKYPEGYEVLPGDADYEAAVGNGRGRVGYYYVARPDAGGAGPGVGHVQSQQSQQQQQGLLSGNGMPGGAGLGAPDGGKTQRLLQRNPSYGATSGSAAGAGPVNAGEGTTGPPSYAEAVKGDNKIQH